MARTAAFLLAAALLGTAAHASYDEPTFGDCMKYDDCTGGEDGDKTTICSFFDSVTVAATADLPQATYNYGKCVQCETSCDCNPDEWCAPAFSIGSKWWNDAQAGRMTDGQKATQAGKLAAYTAGDKMFPGKCVKYGALNDAEAEKIGSTCSNALSGVAAFSQLTKNADHSNQNAYCGYVTNWQAATLPCTGTGCPSPATDNPTADKPGYCTAQVMQDGTTVAAQNADCTASYSAAGGLSKSEQGVGWNGHCNADQACQVCREGSYACTGTNNRRRCTGGTWKAAILISDATARSVGNFAIGQIYVSLMVFMVVLMLAMCINCIFTVRLASKAGGAKERTAQNPAYAA